jgi:hypothetical protein
MTFFSVKIQGGAGQTDPPTPQKTKQNKTKNWTINKELKTNMQQRGRSAVSRLEKGPDLCMNFQ